MFHGRINPNGQFALDLDPVISRGCLTERLQANGLTSRSPVRNSIAPYRSVPPVDAYIVPCTHSFGSMTPRFLTISNLPLFAWAMYMFIRR